MMDTERALLFSSLLALASTLSCSGSVEGDDLGPPDDAVAEANACAHAICQTGTKLSARCDPCVRQICAADPYCCNTRWSSTCVQEVKSVCGQSCTAPPPPPPPSCGASGEPCCSPGATCTGGLTCQAGTCAPRPPPMGGGVGPGGGAVDHLFFAVIGDARPPNLNDTANYPTAIINKIYSDIEAMRPRPQFVVGTGDYMFASTTGAAAADQIALFRTALSRYSGTVFSSMGNHECTGYTVDNCAGKPATANYTAFMNALVKPLGKSLPYYSVPINALDGSWTAKVVIVACNDWDSTQQSWLASQLATPTTYTILVRHQPASDPRGPCVSQVESLMAARPYNLSLVGHIHRFEPRGKEIIVGHAGAPLSGGVYGYATVEQTASGFRITNYDYATGGAISSITVPF